MRHCLPLFLIAISLSLASAALARGPEAATAPRARSGPLAEIDGIIINQASTENGHAFVRVFSEKWQTPPGIMRYNILIRENINPRTGNGLYVFFNDRLADARLIAGRNFNPDEAADQSIRRVQNFLLTMPASADSPDLAASGL